MKFRPIVPGSSDSQKKFTLRPAPEKPPLSKQISLRNIPETPPEAENLGYGTIVGDAEMLNQQDVIPIIDAGVLHGMLRTFENLPKEQQTKETYIALYGYYNTGDSHSAAWVMDYHFPEIFGSGTEVAMSPADFNEIKQQAKLLEGKPEHDKLIVVGAGHTHPNLGADFLSKPDKSIHQIFNRMGALGTGAKIKMSLSKEPSYGKEGEVPVVAIVFDPFSQELTIFYKRLKDKEYKASAGLYIIGHAEADREITRNVEVVFQTDEDIKQKRSTRSSLSIR